MLSDFSSTFWLVFCITSQSFSLYFYNVLNTILFPKTDKIFTRISLIKHVFLVSCTFKISQLSKLFFLNNRLILTLKYLLFIYHIILYHILVLFHHQSQLSPYLQVDFYSVINPMKSDNQLDTILDHLC